MPITPNVDGSYNVTDHAGNTVGSNLSIHDANRLQSSLATPPIPLQDTWLDKAIDRFTEWLSKVFSKVFLTPVMKRYPALLTTSAFFLWPLAFSFFFTSTQQKQPLDKYGALTVGALLFIVPSPILRKILKYALLLAELLGVVGYVVLPLTGIHTKVIPPTPVGPIATYTILAIGAFLIMALSGLLKKFLKYGLIAAALLLVLAFLLLYYTGNLAKIIPQPPGAPTSTSVPHK